MPKEFCQSLHIVKCAVGSGTGTPRLWCVRGSRWKRTGDVSEVVETKGGFYLVCLTDLRAARVDPLAEVAEKIRHKLILEKRKTTEQRFYAEARRSVRVRTYPEVLNSIPFPPGKRPGGRGEAPPGNAVRAAL